MNGHATYKRADHGLTLIEVVVSLALLSTVFVGVLVAFNRHAEQIRGSRRTLDLVRRVEAQLYQWRRSGSAVPRNGRGELPGEDDVIWRTEVVGTDHRRSLGLDVVRMTVLDGRMRDSEGPWITVDLAVPSPKWPIEGD